MKKLLTVTAMALLMGAPLGVMAADKDMKADAKAAPAAMNDHAKVVEQLKMLALSAAEDLKKAMKDGDMDKVIELSIYINEFKDAAIVVAQTHQIIGTDHHKTDNNKTDGTLDTLKMVHDQLGAELKKAAAKGDADAMVKLAADMITLEKTGHTITAAHLLEQAKVDLEAKDAAKK